MHFRSALLVNHSEGKCFQSPLACAHLFCVLRKLYEKLSAISVGARGPNLF